MALPSGMSVNITIPEGKKAGDQLPLRVPRAFLDPNFREKQAMLAQQQVRLMGWLAGWPFVRSFARSFARSLVRSLVRSVLRTLVDRSCARLHFLVQRTLRISLVCSFVECPRGVWFCPAASRHSHNCSSCMRAYFVPD